EADRSLGLHAGIPEDPRELHDQRGARSVVVGGFVVAVPVHVAADDVHLVRVLRADLRDVHLAHGTQDDRPRIERADLLVGLRHRIAVDPGPRAIADDAAAVFAGGETTARGVPASASGAAGGARASGAPLARFHDRSRHAGAALTRGHRHVI